MKKFMVIVMALVLTVGIVVPAYAASSTLEYKGVKADAELDPEFHWSINGSDKATATTEFTTPSGSYRVAVRLERWDDKYTMGGHKYDNDSQLAQCNYTWTDVYSFQSRHSIDNSTNTYEYAVDSFNEEE